MVKISILSTLALGATLASAIRINPETHKITTNNVWENEALVSKMFEDFKVTHKKEYSTETEHLERKAIFANNLKVAAEHQKGDPDAKHGVTQFMDLTSKEFQDMMGLVPVDTSMLRKNLASFAGKPEHPRVQADPDTFDWRDQGAVTLVKNQGSCGSCWSFSTTGCLEGVNFLKTGNLTSLSEQELVDCDHQCDPVETEACDAGCNGGLPSNAMQWIIDNKGLATEADYPYRGIDGTCKQSSVTPAVTANNFTIIGEGDEVAVREALLANGPVSIGLNAGYMQTYVAGVSCPWLCNPKALDHGVLIVGYGQHEIAPARLDFQDYWIIKNSWGPTWGNDGYYHLCKDKNNVCGVASMAVTAE